MHHRSNTHTAPVLLDVEHSVLYTSSVVCGYAKCFAESTRKHPCGVTNVTDGAGLDGGDLRVPAGGRGGEGGQDRVQEGVDYRE